MKIVSFFLLLIVMFSGAAAQQKIDTAANWPPDKFIGAWEMKGKRNTLYETWSRIDNKTMLGKSRKISENGDTTNLEIILLRKEGDDIFYTPTVIGLNNNKPVQFKLTSFSSNSYTFENLLHDFPKRIVYEFTGDDTLHTFIDNGPNEKKRQDFYYRKTTLNKYRSND